MKPLSDQIREAITASCVTRYVLARQAGIPESAISRFMSGKLGLSTSTLDKIAEVLGLQVRVGIQEVLIPRKPGRPKKENTKMQQQKTLNSVDWDSLAQHAAKDANEKNFSSRRGLYVVEGIGIVYYDNNPFKLPRENDRREELISLFRAFLRSSHIQEKSCAYYPMSGKSKDYTFVMVIEAQEFMLKAIRLAFLEFVDSFVNGWHEGIELGHPADGDSRRYTIPSSLLEDENMSDSSITAHLYTNVLFEFLCAGTKPRSLRGIVIIRDREMVLEVQLPGDRPYLIKGVVGDGFFEGDHEGLVDDIPVHAKWNRLDDLWIGTWHEDGIEYLFTFRLRGPDKTSETAQILNKTGVLSAPLS
jgi:transcriptional regulator with XRE-family HTH domain